MDSKGFVHATLSQGDNQVEGYELTGKGISAESVVRIDGQTFEELGFIGNTTSSKTYLMVPDTGTLLEPGEHTVELENPGGWASNSLTIILE